MTKMKNVKVHHIVFIESDTTLFAGQYVRRGAWDERTKILHIRSKVQMREDRTLYECILETGVPYELWEPFEEAPAGDKQTRKEK